MACEDFNHLVYQADSSKVEINPQDRLTDGWECSSEFIWSADVRLEKLDIKFCGDAPRAWGCWWGTHWRGNAQHFLAPIAPFWRCPSFWAKLALLETCFHPIQSGFLRFDLLYMLDLYCAFKNIYRHAAAPRWGMVLKSFRTDAESERLFQKPGRNSGFKRHVFTARQP